MERLTENAQIENSVFCLSLAQARNKQKIAQPYFFLSPRKRTVTIALIKYVETEY